MTPLGGVIFHPCGIIWTSFIEDHMIKCYIPNMKALGLVVFKVKGHLRFIMKFLIKGNNSVNYKHIQKSWQYALEHMIRIILWKFGENHLRTVGARSCAHKKFSIKGNNSVKYKRIQKSWQYALGHIIRFILWKFGENRLRTVGGVAHTRNFQ